MGGFVLHWMAAAAGKGVLTLESDIGERVGHPWEGVKDQDSEAALFTSRL